MTFLVTNDDGIFAPALRRLRDALSPLGRVVIVAPDRDQSATSHSLTLHRPFRIHRHEEDFFSVDGTPTDCVVAGYHGLLDLAPDMVISGINHGPNMGEDVFYSGTVAAAIEGTLQGVPSIAVSLVTRELADFIEPAQFVARLVQRVLDHGLPRRQLLNVNLPHRPWGEIQGVEIARGIRDPQVLEVMAIVPRHRFVDPALVARAYGDHALPTAEGQTISQPYIVARMLELAQLEPHHRALEIGTGSGYQTALLARLVERVFSVERMASLLRAAQRRLEALGIQNVALRHGDGSLGWQEFSPYDRVVVAAAAPRVPDALRAQLGERGFLVIPVGGPQFQHMEVWYRSADGQW